VTNGHSTNNARRILFWRERKRERERESWSSSSCTRTRLRPGKGSNQESEVKKRLVFLLLLHRSLCYGSTGTHTFLDRLEEEATKATISNGRTERDSLSLCASASEEACCASKQASCTSGDRYPFHKTFRKQQKQQQQ
jgi:hypothetical protein